MIRCKRIACQKEFSILSPLAVHVRIEAHTHSGILPASYVYCSQKCFDLTMAEIDQKGLFTAMEIIENKKVSDTPAIYEMKIKNKFDLKIM